MKRFPEFGLRVPAALCCAVLIWCSTTPALSEAGDNLPVKIPRTDACADVNLRNPKDFEKNIEITAHPRAPQLGLQIDLGDPAFFGKIYTGPYPFEADESDYDYARWGKYQKSSGRLKEGKGLLMIETYFGDYYNTNGWPKKQFPFVGTIAYRVQVWRKEKDGGNPKYYGFYGGLATFRREKDKDGKIRFAKHLTIVEGPLVSMVTSDDPSSIMIAWKTDVKSKGRVKVYKSNVREVWIKPSERKDKLRELQTYSSEGRKFGHEVKISGLNPDTYYFYEVESEATKGEKIRSDIYGFHSAPLKGKGTFKFAYAGDSREGSGGGDRNYMGHNRLTLDWIAKRAFRNKADFFLFGGDLINGYTSDKNDFVLQLNAWKQTFAGFWHSRPVFPIMGNHEALADYFQFSGVCSKYGLGLDKSPYETHSTEAVFADAFYNPTDGPSPSDDRRPPYKENVYKFQYGPLLVMGLNNNYWYTAGVYANRQKVFSNFFRRLFGGSPEGYMMEDQLEWIEKTLEEAEDDDTVMAIILYAQEPVFPCGGHIQDAMWYKGDNTVRAYTKDRSDGQVKPERLGIIDVRNRLWQAVARSSKVACFLTADEHAYARVLIDDKVPVGLPAQDDPNGDGQLENCHPVTEKCSANKEFKQPTWHITIGTAGAPYYSIQDTPWRRNVQAHTSQEGYSLFEVKDGKISMKFISLTGQIIDRVDDLLAIKNKASQ
ncbi:fibronectin type III domain-containing protein [Thermodesulfobacteriota bacterium]